MVLIGVELLRELIETVVLTGRIKNTDPISLLLIAPPEHGKTSVVLERPSKAILPLSDVTGRGLHQVCRLNPAITHIIITDMITVMSHKPTVNKYTLATLNAMTEEGIGNIAFPNSFENYEHGKRAIIAALTTDLAADGRQWWNKSGFASRMLPFHFIHSTTLTMKIKEAICDTFGEAPGKKQEFFVPEKPVEVRMPEEIGNIKGPLARLAENRAKLLGDPKGYRKLKHYQALARAHALHRTRKNPVVTREDVAFIAAIDPFVSYKVPRPL